MRTPAGTECRHFFGDYFRGRSREECRLLMDATPPVIWKRDYCQTCPVPEILLANACDHLILEPGVVRPFPFTRQRVAVTAYCNQSHRRGFDAHIGCGECHPLPFTFLGDST